MNQKGGTAKTITAINLAATLSREHGYNVLLVDADSQANLTEYVCTPELAAQPGQLPELLRGKKVFPQQTKITGVDILTADERLMALDVSAAGSGVANAMALADFLGQPGVPMFYDQVVIDCPPAFSAAAMAALIAADDVVIPIKLDAFGIRGMSNLLEQVRNMRRINPDLSIAGVLPTVVYPTDQQRRAEADLREALTKKGIRCFHHIRRSVKVDDSTFCQRPLLESSPKSGACHDYKVFTAELIGPGAEGGGHNGL